MTRFHIWTGWLALLFIALLSATRAAAAQTRDPATFDIAGVRLGMTPKQALAALHAAGYASQPRIVTGDTYGDSFLYRAHRSAEEKLGVRLPDPPQDQVLRGYSREAGDGSRVTVVFDSWPQGPRVYSVSYSAGKLLRSQSEDIDARIRAKYGTPSSTVISPVKNDDKKPVKITDYWCAPSVKRCGHEMGTSLARLIETKWDTGGRELRLVAGDSDSDRLGSLVKAEGEKIAAAAVKNGQGPVQIKVGSAVDLARRDPSTFDVAGVKIDMTPQQATAALTAAGYRQSTRFPPNRDVNFEQAVQREIQRKTGVPETSPPRQGLAGLTFEGPGDAQVRLHFTEWPDGPRVSSVHYQVPKAHMNFAAFRQRVESKYGPPSGSQVQDDMWCSRATVKCGHNFADGIKDPYLSATRIDADNFLTVSLAAGGAYGSRHYQALEAEVERRLRQLSAASQ